MTESRTCPSCGRTTWHPVDVATGWCSACETFTGRTREQVLAVADSGWFGDEVSEAIRRRVRVHLP